MRFLVSHLTRMTHGHICVAGIDLTSGEHIRPKRRTHLPLDLAGSRGGPFALGAMLDLRRLRNVGRRPEMEDREFSQEHLTVKDPLPPAFFWRVLTRQAETSLVGIFGPELRRERRTWVLAAERGFASLGCLAPAEIRRLWVTEYGRVRITLVTDEGECTLPVTDLRLYDHTPEADYQVGTDVVAWLAEQLRQPGHVLLSVGLSRPFAREHDEDALHWLQVNNIHLEHDPLWAST